MTYLYNLYKNLVNREDGQGMAEYGLILALVSVAAVVALGAMGDQLTPLFQAVTTQLTP